jgi:hypothetical protein
VEPARAVTQRVAVAKNVATRRPNLFRMTLSF